MTIRITVAKNLDNFIFSIVYFCNLSDTVPMTRDLLFVVGFFILLLSTSCGKIKNSNSSDKAIFGLSNQGSAQFKLAFSILAKNCNSCHSEWNNYNEGDFITGGLVAPSDPAQSSVYSRLTNNDLGIAGNMPIGSSPLTAEEIAVIKAWVLIATP